jgi:hypothetical protein
MSLSLLLPHKSVCGSDRIPLLQERAFSVRLRCNACDRETSQVIRMADEPNDPATMDDFYRSDAMKEVDPDCMYCGHHGTTILGSTYLRQPGDEHSGFSG